MNSVKGALTQNLPACFIGIAENIVGIITLGFYIPNWVLPFYAWRLYPKIKKK